MRLLLRVDGDIAEGGDAFDCRVESALIAPLQQARGDDLLLVANGEAALARLASIEGMGDEAVACFDHLRRMDAALAGLVPVGFRLQMLTDADYDALIQSADALTFPLPPPSPISTADEISGAFSYAAADIATVGAVIATLRKATGNVCALTGQRLAANAVPTPIWPRRDAGLHVNNFLLLSPGADVAFANGHFTARDDMSVIVDLALIDPELLERINANGRLKVPDNPALRPAPENLAWHRHRVFRLN